MQVVVHSSWRHEISLAGIKSHMPPTLAQRVVAITPMDAWERLDSIRAYCGQNSVDRFLIIDDTEGEFPKDLAELVPCGEGGMGDPATVSLLRERLQRLCS